jgi:hypothetical protein
MKIELKAEVWRDRGRWHIALEGPRWILVDIAEEARKGIVLSGGPVLHGGQSPLTQQSCMTFMTFEEQHEPLRD